MTDKNSFIDFLLEQGVLQFGDFTLNSGRQSPYFFNLGAVSTGSAFAQLGEAYADTIIDCGFEPHVLFGPAYKGIPIAVATAVALARRGMEVGVTYNRKEAKDHGEGGRLVGAQVDGRVLLIDDVLTSGKAIREAVTQVSAAGAAICGAVIAMDRQELGANDATAVTNLAVELGAPVKAIANLGDLIGYLESSGDPQSRLPGMRAYRQKYCDLSNGND